MNAFEWTSVIFAFLAGLGSLAAWIISQQRLNSIEQQANTANNIAKQSNDLANTANLISKQALSSQTSRFKSVKLDKISKEFGEQVKSFKRYGSQTVPRRQLMLYEFYPFLVNLKRYEMGIFNDQSIDSEIESLIENIRKFIDLSYEYEFANEDYKSATGNSNLYVILNINKDPELKALAELRSSTSKALQETNRTIEDESVGLLNKITEELKNALRESSKYN